MMSARHCRGIGKRYATGRCNNRRRYDHDLAMLAISTRAGPDLGSLLPDEQVGVIVGTVACPVDHGGGQPQAEPGGIRGRASGPSPRRAQL